MSIESIIETSQDYLLQTGETLTLEASVPEMVETLARLCPVFGNVGVIYNRWVVGLYVAATRVFIDATADVAGPGDISICTPTAGDALLCGAAGPFDTVTFTIVQPDTGTPLYQWSYWTGWQWAPLLARTQPNFRALGAQTLTFAPPDDWRQGTPPAITFPAGFVTDQFWLRLQTPTPPATAALASTIALTQRFFPLPDNVLQLLSVHFFPRELEPAGVRWAQDTLDPAWRTRTGMPTRYTQELETTRLVRLHPSPTVSGPQGIPPFVGIPGAMVPTNHLVTFVLEAPDVVDLAVWWEDMVAYLLAAWEATREGVRQDAAMAQALQTLVGVLVGMCKELAHEPGEEITKGAWQMPLWFNLPLT